MVHGFGVSSLRSKKLISKIRKKPFLALPLNLKQLMFFRAEETNSLNFPQPEFKFQIDANECSTVRPLLSYRLLPAELGTVHTGMCTSIRNASTVTALCIGQLSNSRGAWEGSSHPSHPTLWFLQAGSWLLHFQHLHFGSCCLPALSLCSGFCFDLSLS